MSWSRLPCLLFATDKKLQIVSLDGTDAGVREDLVGKPVALLLKGFDDAPWLAQALDKARHGESAGRESRLQGVPVTLRLGPRMGAKGVPDGIVGMVAARAVQPDERPRNFFQNVLEHSQASVAVLSSEGKVTYWSPAARQALGYAPHDLLGHALLDFTHPQDHASLSDALAATASRPGQPYLTLIRLKHRNGMWRQMETQMLALPADPEVRGVVLSTRDVTDSNEAWRELEKSELFYRNLLTNAFDAIEVLGPKGQRKFVSPAIRNVLGYTEDQWLALRPFEIVHPDDKAALREAWLGMTDTPDGRVEMELRLRHLNGEWRTVHALARNRLDDPVIQGVVTNWRDITAEREESRRRQSAEDTYRLLASASPYAIYQLDAEGRFATANDAAARMFATATAAELQGRPFLEVVSPDDRAGVAQVLQAARRGEAAELDFTTPNGSVIRASLVPVLDRSEQGRVAGLGQDITRVRQEELERTALEAQLRQAQKLESIGQLAGGIAHDFNNILMVIMAHASFLERELTHGPERRDLTNIIAGAQRAAQLTRQLLTVSKQQPISLTTMDMPERIASLGEMLRRLLPESIELELPPAAGSLAIKADPSQFDQVVLNLVLNARDAMPEGGRLRVDAQMKVLDVEFVRLHPWARPGRFVLLRVIDSGSGMSPDVVARVFEPFFTTKAPGRGTGLGLAMVYGIVQRHGGLLHVDSTPAQGSTFSIYWPADESSGVSELVAGTGPALGGQERILVAEDDPDVRGVVTRVLRRAGYDILEAVNGEQAVDIALREHVDMVVLDSIMPRLSGPEAYRRIRARKPDMRFLFCSGYASETQGRDSWRQDGVAFLGKPYEPDTLLRFVRATLDRTPIPTLSPPLAV